MSSFDPSQNPGEINVQLDEETAEGVYSNLVMISHSPEEFVFDFIRVVPGVQNAKVKSRIIVTPQHARRLLNALQENVERYEEAHGDISQPDQPSPGMRFGKPGAEA